MDPVETVEYRGYEIDIVVDAYPDDPRNWDTLGRMLCSHGRYQLGDRLEWAAPGWSKDWNSRFSSWSEVKEAIYDELGAEISLPLYMYDHTGITISTTPFASVWDSGQIGFIYATRDDILKGWGRQRLSKKLLNKVRPVLEGEVEIYDSYVRGDVYGYVVHGTLDGTFNSCYGYYGWDEAEGYMLDEAKSIADHDIEKRTKQYTNQVKARQPLVLHTGHCAQ